VASAASDFIDRARIGATPVPLERIGVDRFTGKVIAGEDHERQSVDALLSTRFHELITRRWVGSFLPHAVGQTATPRGVLRVVWAVTASVDLYEPNWTVRRVTFPSLSNKPGDVAAGLATIKVEYDQAPRGHLGDDTPDTASRAATFGPSKRWGLPI
jgi:phage baseplate assembly protein W